jgi:hypothetical protein
VKMLTNLVSNTVDSRFSLEFRGNFAYGNVCLASARQTKPGI